MKTFTTVALLGLLLITSVVYPQHTRLQKAETNKTASTETILATTNPDVGLIINNNHIKNKYTKIKPPGKYKKYKQKTKQVLKRA